MAGMAGHSREPQYEAWAIAERGPHEFKNQIDSILFPSVSGSAESKFSRLDSLIGSDRGLGGFVGHFLNPDTFEQVLQTLASEPIAPELRLSLTTALLFRSKRVATQFSRESPTIKYLSMLVTKDMGNEGPSVNLLSALASIFAIQPGARAFFPSLQAFLGKLPELHAKGNRTIAVAFFRHHALGSRRAEDPLDVPALLSQCFKTIENMASPMVRRLEAVDVLTAILRNPAVLDEVDKFGDEVVPYVTTLGTSVQTFCRRYSAMNASKIAARDLLEQMLAPIEVLSAFLAHGSLQMQELTSTVLGTIDFNVEIGWTLLKLADQYRLLCTPLFNAVLRLLNSAKATIPSMGVVYILEARACDKHPLGSPALESVEFLRVRGTGEQIASCRDNLRAAMIQSGGEGSTVEVQIRRFACILLADDWKENSATLEYLKMLSTDGRAIYVLRKALLSHDADTIDLAMQLAAVFYQASDQAFPEAGCFVDAWATHNKNANTDKEVFVEDYKQQVAQAHLKLSSKQAEMEAMEKQFELKSRNFENRLDDMKESYEETIAALRAELTSNETQYNQKLRAMEKRLQHVDSLLQIKETSGNRYSEQADSLRNERDVAERDSAVLRRKLKALEGRAEEIAQQLLDALRSGAKEVASMEEKIAELSEKHEQKVLALKTEHSKTEAAFESKVNTLSLTVKRHKDEVNERTKRLEETEDIMHKLVDRLQKLAQAYELKDEQYKQLKIKLVDLQYS
jgi:hypothetical protein